MELDIKEFLFDFGIFIGIFLATFLVAYIFNRLFKRFIKKSSLIMQNDPTNYQFLRHILSAIIYVLGFSWAIYSVPELKSVANSLLAGAGILAVAVGFASQHALSNVISGLFIVIFKPFRVNDRLRLRNDLLGIVEDITLRHTVIRDFENRRILIPNAVISDEVIINSDFADENICLFFELRISYESDIDRVKAIIREEAMKHPLHLDVRKPEQIFAGEEVIKVRVIGLEEYFVKVRAWVWTKDNGHAWDLKCDLSEQVLKRFKEEGIEFPYPHRTIIEKQKKVAPNVARHQN